MVYEPYETPVYVALTITSVVIPLDFSKVLDLLTCHSTSAPALFLFGARPTLWRGVALVLAERHITPECWATPRHSDGRGAG